MVSRKWWPALWLLERAELPVVILRSYLGYRNFIIGAVYLCCSISWWLAFELRYDFQVPPDLSTYQKAIALLVALLKTLVFILLGGHSISWRYIGLRDSGRLLAFSVVSSIIVWTFCFLDGFVIVRRGIILIDFCMSSIFVAGFFVSLRLYHERFLNLAKADLSVPTKRVVVLGAGDGGEMIVREIIKSQMLRLSVMALFDDNPLKRGTRIHGVPVVGGLEHIPAYVRKHGIHMVLVAIPSANRDEMKRIHQTLAGLEVSVKTLPPLNEFIKGNPSLAQLRDIDISDLLGRKEIQIDGKQISDMIRGKVLLVTGAGGSIGSELCRQTLKQKPAEILLVERSENSLFHLHRNLVELNGSTSLVPILCDITDERRVFEIFTQYRPELVFHAAAHKHVPLQELNPLECFRNNVGGSRNVFRAADVVGVGLCMMISTDKAVNPTSVMGATKRACEVLCQAYAHVSNTKYVAVRFGNVLGSEGSVVPIFLEQIARGGPITVTHPDMKRYFMTIPEAVTLVLQAAAIGQSGQVLILDMGQPIRIVDLAYHLLQLTGKNPGEVPIEFVGLRPGEKLFEELACDGETCLRTSHESIWIFDQNGSRGLEDVEAIERALTDVHGSHTVTEARSLLMQIVPEYTPVSPLAGDVTERIKSVAAQN